MLARKYNNEEQWTQSERERLRELDEQKQRRQRIRKANYKLFRRRLFVTVGIVLAMYFATVMRSAALVSAGNHLISLQNQESQLIAKNAELKIEVDQLKGPERITSIAEKQLGMKVARSNIYVKAINQ
ncbi:MAG: cell division protein FtsL [Acidaminococcaceae bacterium]|nr:cell division protein FtsL [Acidaminococcaceae bacterium]HBX75819.1 cell division protein FtsL [Acidaminococcaceae bacterium]